MDAEGANVTGEGFKISGGWKWYGVVSYYVRGFWGSASISPVWGVEGMQWRSLQGSVWGLGGGGCYSRAEEVGLEPSPTEPKQSRGCGAWDVARGDAGDHRTPACSPTT